MTKSQQIKEILVKLQDKIKTIKNYNKTIFSLHLGDLIKTLENTLKEIENIYPYLKDENDWGQYEDLKNSINSFIDDIDNYLEKGDQI